MSEQHAASLRIAAYHEACKQLQASGVPLQDVSPYGWFVEGWLVGHYGAQAAIRHVLTLLPDRPDEARGWLEECLR